MLCIVDLVAAVLAATEFTHIGIETAPGLGRGNGPLNHLHSFIARSIPKCASHNRIDAPADRA
jgi:hydroxymethylpyrimidine/phosphomethylpyrimidine kinase / thiaminase